jgi:AcrR family transcriptional regulator
MLPERKEKRRAQIVEGATRAFAEKGYGGTQIADIAQHLGIGHGTVYRYFKDKTDVFRAVLTDAITKVGSALADEAPGAETLEEYEAQIERIARRLYDLVDQDRAVARLIFEEAISVREIGGELTQAMEAFAMMTAEYLVHGQRRGFLRPDFSPEIAARAINSMIFEGARHILRAADGRAALELWSRELGRLFIRGIAATKE